MKANQTMQTHPDKLTLTAEASIDVEAAGDGGDGEVKLPRFRMVAYTGTPMRVAGWRAPVVVDLAGLAIPNQKRPIRFSHDPAAGVGHTDSIRIDKGKLIAAGVVSRDTAVAREVVASSKNGFPWQASIGSSVDEFEFIKDGQTVLVNGQSFTGPLNVIRKATLGEISFVDLGADGETSAHIAAISNHTPNHQEYADMSNPGKTSTDAASQAATAEHSQASGTDLPGVDSGRTDAVAAAQVSPLQSIEQIRAQAAAETQRIAAVRRICNGRFSDIEANAIRDGWDATRTELEVLRASRPKAPMVHVPMQQDVVANGQMLEAACLLSAKHSGVERMFDEQTLDLAARRFRGGIGLQELLLEAAWANGYTGRSFRDPRNILAAAFGTSSAAPGGPGVQAAFSTIDVGGILSNVSNKFLLEGFFSVERTWRNICAVRNVSDFKTVTSYRLIGKDQYEQVAPGGELKHGSLGEESYSNKADTYGLMLSIDRRDVINDDLGAITTAPRKLGRGSGLKINDVFWSIFLGNAAFFTDPRKNYVVGAGTALDIDALNQVEVAFADQVDSDGKPIGIMPAILLVPTALSATATMLHKSLEIRDTTASTKYPVANPHAGKFRPEVSRYLANQHYAGSSAKAWYLLADPSDLAVIEVAFLNGQESPTIETAEADFNVLGIQMRGYHDFGVALQEPKAGVKAKGEA